MSAHPDAERHGRRRDFTWTEQDDRAVAEHTDWDRHVTSAMRQSRQRDHVDDMPDDAAAGIVDAQLRSADAVHRRNALGHVLEALAVVGVVMFGAVVALVAAALWVTP